ncbi:ribonuclease H-like domain-containing protein [Tanacetum coccineum]|uniref:Ribonuclease H-like domain-containing protein n=1 Tax=Tanacetum coccineum TaxID=301880 RepID=A0ABQ4XCU8_9ASTR
MAAITINSLDAGNPLFLHNNDHSILPIVGFKLIGSENYKMWSTAMKIALKGKYKMGFIDVTCVKPATSPVLAQQWERCNDELEETYDKMDGSVIFNVVQKINGLKQGDLSVPKYYHTLNSLWREFDILSLLPACTCAAHEGLLKHNQLVRLMQFLMGLNDVYQPIRSNLLARDPLPDVKDAFAVVVREESHRGLAPGKITAKTNPAAFVAKTNNGNNNFNNNRRVNSNNNSNRGPNPNLVCKHYGLIGHTIERCYELNAYPAGFKRNPNLSKQSGFVKKFNGNNVDASQSGSTSTGFMTASFTNDQMIKLLSLINEKPATNVYGSMACNMPCFFNNCTYFNLHIDKFFCAKTNAYAYNVTLGWIINSGANQHMTVSTQNMFNVVDISSLQLSVGHPNRTVAKFTTIGSLRLTEHVVLFDVLVIPEYTVNLLSVNKMIKDNKSFVGFHKSKCYIQDLILGKIVGTGSETAGLYMFDCVNSGKSFAGLYNSGTVCFVSKELWHCRVGHPADQVLSVLSDKIGFKTGDHVSACDICHKAKQTREPFPLSDHKSGGIPLSMWPECVLTATYLINRLPSFVLSGASPFKIVYGKEPSLSYLRAFGCLCYSTVLNNNDKFGSRSEKDVRFYETVFPFKMQDLSKERCVTDDTSAEVDPDIAYDVHYLSQHMHAPLQSHFNARLRVLRYLKQAPGTRVQFDIGLYVLVCNAFLDADWAKCLKTRKSVSGFCIYFCNNLVSWKSKKQATISRSYAESEYRCLTSTTCEIVWIAKILKDLDIEGLFPVDLYCDSSVAIQIAANLIFYEKTKYFEIDLHLVRENVSSGVIKTLKIGSANNVADVFTKGLSVTQHAEFSAITINFLYAGNPLFLHNNDHSNFPIVGFKLIGSENYKMWWSTAMKIALKDVMLVLGWILGSLSQKLYLGQLFLNCFWRFRMNVEETYVIWMVLFFFVVQKINGLKQGDLSVPKYYHTLNSLWREFDILSLLPACTCAAHEGLLKHNQLVRLMQFLMGLMGVSNLLRSNLLQEYPLIIVKMPFCVVVREESHRGLALGKISAKTNPAVFEFFFLLMFSWIKLLSLINEKPATNVSGSMAGNMPCFFNNCTYFNQHIDKFFCAKTNAYAYNVTLGWIIDSGANQMNVSTQNMFNVVDISSLQLSVSHPNGTMAKITTIGLPSYYSRSLSIMQ